jgi:hypothetical protein
MARWLKPGIEKRAEARWEIKKGAHSPPAEAGGNQNSPLKRAEWN